VETLKEMDARRNTMERYEAELRKLRPLCLDDYGQRLPHERVAYFRKKRWQLRAWATSGCTSKWRTSGNRRLGHNDFGQQQPPSHAAYLWPTTPAAMCGRRLRTAVPRADYDGSRCTSKRQISGRHDVPQRFGQPYSQRKQAAGFEQQPTAATGLGDGFG
jgi:hypothetical protein